MEKPKILLAEDSQILSKVIARQLGDEFTVDVAQDGAEAMELLSKCEYRALLLDLVMPRADGYEVLQALRQAGSRLPVIILTAKPKAEVEGEIGDYRPEGILTKPVDNRVLADSLRRAVGKHQATPAGEPVLDPATGRKYPFLLVRQSCYICGFDRVPRFEPVSEGYAEDWSAGPYPVFRPRGGYAEWDLLKTMITVCPYCFFASADREDFCDGDTSLRPYPYHEDSKKILARAISFRKKMVPEAQDVDERFSAPGRNKATVVTSLMLAEKCSNGLILGGKPGCYARSGHYTTLLGSLHHPQGERYYREALMSFENQLKAKDTPRAVLIKTYYFCMVLNMLLGKTRLGRDILKKVEELYKHSQVEDLAEEEREWLLRLNNIWKTGIAADPARDIA